MLVQGAAAQRVAKGAVAGCCCRVLLAGVFHCANALGLPKDLNLIDETISGDHVQHVFLYQNDVDIAAAVSLGKHAEPNATGTPSCSDPTGCISCAYYTKNMRPTTTFTRESSSVSYQGLNK